MIDVFDIFAFVVFAVLLAAVVIIVVTLGPLPGQIAHRRGHPQAAAISAASWLGVATLGLLWPFALIWAFLKPSAAVTSGSAADPEAKADMVQMQAYPPFYQCVPAGHCAAQGCCARDKDWLTWWFIPTPRALREALWCQP